MSYPWHQNCETHSGLEWANWPWQIQFLDKFGILDNTYSYTFLEQSKLVCQLLSQVNPNRYREGFQKTNFCCAPCWSWAISPAGSWSWASGGCHSLHKCCRPKGGSTSGRLAWTRASPGTSGPWQLCSASSDLSHPLARVAIQCLQTNKDIRALFTDIFLAWVHSFSYSVKVCVIHKQRHLFRALFLGSLKAYPFSCLL